MICRSEGIPSRGISSLGAMGEGSGTWEEFPCRRLVVAPPEKKNLYVQGTKKPLRERGRSYRTLGDVSGYKKVPAGTWTLIHLNNY